VPVFVLAVVLVTFAAGVVNVRRSVAAALRTPAPVIPPESSPVDWLARLTLRRVIVHTCDDQSIEGLVELAGAEGVLLRDAKMLGTKSVELAGEIYVARGNVSFVQVAGSPSPPAS
jgi:hypothetical protein